MAGRGPAPKEGLRHGRQPRARGDWVDLPPVRREPPKLPRGTWPPRTKAAWASWWRDPASTQWTEADDGAVLELAYLHSDLVNGRVSLASEVRLRMDILGLTQKGKRDLRWRTPAAATVSEPADVTSLDDYRDALG